jgi:hypothetical protein
VFRIPSTIRIKPLLREILTELITHMGIVWRSPLGAATPCEDFTADGVFLHASISFRGKHTGMVEMTLPPALCLCIAPRLLDESETRNSRDLAIRAIWHLSQRICQLLIGRIGWAAEDIKIAEPSVAYCDAGKWHELAADHDSIRLWVEDLPLILTATVLSGESEYEEPSALSA